MPPISQDSDRILHPKGRLRHLRPVRREGDPPVHHNHSSRCPLRQFALPLVLEFNPVRTVPNPPTKGRVLEGFSRVSDTLLPEPSLLCLLFQDSAWKSFMFFIGLDAERYGHDRLRRLTRDYALRCPPKNKGIEGHSATSVSNSIAPV